MAYAHYQIEKQFIVNATAAGPIVSFLTSGTGEKGRVTAGNQNYILRRVTAVMYASSTTKKPVFSLRLATTAGATSATGMEIRKMSVASGKAAGSIITTPWLNTSVLAGQEVILHVLTAATKALKVRATAYLEPDWETPANNTKITTATA